MKNIQKKWNTADVEERKSIIKKSYALILEDSKVKLPLKFNVDRGSAGYFDQYSGVLYWAAENAFAKQTTYMYMLSTLVHELTHAEQFKDMKQNNDLKRSYLYYVYLYMDTFAYHGNYIEQEAYHREAVFADKLIGNSHSKVSEIQKIKYLSEKNR